MKRVLLSITATVVGLVALLSFKTHGRPLTPTGGLPSAAAAAPTDSGRPRSGTTTSAPPRSGAAGPTVARQYTGSAVQTRYGVVQVAVRVSGRHIDSVKFLQLTAFDPHSQDINSQAGPILLQETLRAQSGHVDTVSGATYTSDGYLQSLQSALDRAGVRS
jgi:uncharacterized protein with FMN-binding domain